MRGTGWEQPFAASCHGHSTGHSVPLHHDTKFSTLGLMLTHGDNLAVAALSDSEFSAPSLQPGWVTSLQGGPLLHQT